MNKHEKKIISNATKIAFLEIRASKNLSGAQMLADIFHTVPSQSISGRTFEEIKNDVLFKAEKYGVEDIVSRWFS